MHIPGLLGMPRRIYTYEPGRGWDTLNFLITIGAVHPGRRDPRLRRPTSSCPYFRGALAGNDPWDAWTLEWSTSSPPPAYNFATIPTRASRRPLWDLKHPRIRRPVRVMTMSRR
jgi:cytochrome c oxidase subunit 1